MGNDEQRERWIDCVVISLVVGLVFLLIVTPCFSRWMASQIPSTSYRTIAAAGLMMIVAFIVAAIVVNRRDKHCGKGRNPCPLLDGNCGC